MAHAAASPNEADAAPHAAAHAQLSKCASRLGGTDSKHVGMVSRHAFPATLSFANLAELHETLRAGKLEARAHDYVATSNGRLVYSARFDHASAAAQAPSPSGSAGSGATASRKRRRDDDGELEALEAAIVEARKKVKGVEAIAETDVDAAEALLARATQNLRGPAGERVVQSYGLLPKKLHAEDESERLIVALRCMPGVAISVAGLRSAMGGFWQDGMVSVETDDSGLKLPCTDEGRVAEAHGNASLLVVTSAPRVHAHRNGK